MVLTEISKDPDNFQKVSDHINYWLKQGWQSPKTFHLFFFFFFSSPPVPVPWSPYLNNPLKMKWQLFRTLPTCACSVLACCTPLLPFACMKQHLLFLQKWLLPSTGVCYVDIRRERSSTRPLGYVFFWANEQLVRGNVLWKKLLSDVGQWKEANEQLVI